MARGIVAGGGVAKFVGVGVAGPYPAGPISRSQLSLETLDDAVTVSRDGGVC
jgi:hypothetical protein